MIRTKKGQDGLATELTFKSELYQLASRALLKAVPYIPSDGRYNITICHEKKFIWFRVPKVGTRTIFNIFEQSNVALDAEHSMFCHYPTRLYKDYFKFAFVRSPWTRLVSCWRNKIVDSNYFNLSDTMLSKMQSFDSFVDYVERRNIENCDQHLRLQAKLIDLNNIDYIGRFENFEEHLTNVAEIIGLRSVKIPRLNPSSKNIADYHSYYSDATKAKVSEIYRKDIELFSYRF